MLEAEASIALTGDAATDVALVALAFAATRLVERIGGKRRRGSGRCTVTITSVRSGGADLPSSIEEAIERLARIDAPAAPAPLRNADLATAFEDASAAAFTRIDIDVTVETPTVVGRAVLGNVVTSLDHIPGTMLLAGVARMLDPQGTQRPRIAAAFASGDIRVLPAYPVVAGERGLPVPFVYEQLKDDRGGPGGKGRLRNRLDPHPGGHRQYQPIGNDYLAFRRGATGALELAFARPRLTTRTHNTVDDAHPDPDRARRRGLFVRGDHRRLAAEIPGVGSSGAVPLSDPLAPVPVTIGRAKKSGYGAVTLAPGAVLAAAAPRAAAAFRLYAASDILLPASPLRAAPALPGRVLVRRDQADRRHRRRGHGWRRADRPQRGMDRALGPAASEPRGRQGRLHRRAAGHGRPHHRCRRARAARSRRPGRAARRRVRPRADRSRLRRTRARLRRRAPRGGEPRRRDHREPPGACRLRGAHRGRRAARRPSGCMPSARS
ncbi:MAG: hypothetical protein M5U07_16675 [Xanthobacteraceae bacterium]|nr:hypothetical protein [Xanthobacteraceae bacterium]